LQQQGKIMNQVLYWNAILLEASRRDHSQGYANNQQQGPTNTSRAMAIVHLAIHDAIAFVREPKAAYLKKKDGITMTPSSPNFGLEDVIDGAAYTSLSAMYPKFESYLKDSLGPSKQGGFNFGRDVALRLLETRANDGANASVPAGGQPPPGSPAHRVDPYNPSQGLLGAHWGAVRLFVGPHTPLGDYPGYAGNSQPTGAHYLQDFTEVREFGGKQRQSRTAEQELIGVYWGYDGAQGLGVPPRLYNQIARKIAIEQNLNLLQCAELFAQTNVAMADAGIDAWRHKFDYNLWRPVVGIRLDPSSEQDVFWAPLGAPQTNRPGTRPTTPQFPAYPSGHATFGAALFQTLRLRSAFGAAPITVPEVLATESDDPVVAAETFNFVSDELDGRAVDTDGSVRTLHDRKLNSYSKAIFENAISRVYLGVHWRFDGLPRDGADNIGGVPLGLEIGKKVHKFFNDAPSLGGAN
jgi:hypothetical protein